jgi:FkbM family methyltransferase
LIHKAFIKEVGPLRWLWRTAIRQYYKRIARRDHTMRLPTGEWMTLPISDRFATEAFITQGDVDWGSEALLVSMLNREGVFLDVGAHIGYYSLYVLPRVLEVYSFEPDPRVRVLLEKNVSGRPNISVLPWAVGARQGRARFTLEEHSEVSHLSAEGEESSKQVVVEVITIDEFVRLGGLPVEAIKIDVEGHDTEVIKGALNVLAEQQPLVLTEARPDAVLFALTGRVEYRVFAYVRQPKTRKKWLAELFSNLPIPGETKMLFLVPERLAEKFAKLSSQTNL